MHVEDVTPLLRKGDQIQNPKLNFGFCMVKTSDTILGFNLKIDFKVLTLPNSIIFC